MDDLGLPRPPGPSLPAPCSQDIPCTADTVGRPGAAPGRSASGFPGCSGAAKAFHMEKKHRERETNIDYVKHEIVYIYNIIYIYIHVCILYIHVYTEVCVYVICASILMDLSAFSLVGKTQVLIADSMNTKTKLIRHQATRASRASGDATKTKGWRIMSPLVA